MRIRDSLLPEKVRKARRWPLSEETDVKIENPGKGVEEVYIHHNKTTSTEVSFKICLEQK